MQSIKIYKLCNTINDSVYIGKTSRSLDDEMKFLKKEHKSQTTKLYKAMMHIGFSKFSISLLKEFPIHSREIASVFHLSYIFKYSSINNGLNEHKDIDLEAVKKILNSKRAQRIINPVYQCYSCDFSTSAKMELFSHFHDKHYTDMNTFYKYMIGRDMKKFDPLTLLNS